MPRREDERHENIRERGGLRYCVFCKRYYSSTEWGFHPHNPDFSRPGPIGAFRRLRRLFARR